MLNRTLKSNIAHGRYLSVLSSPRRPMGVRHVRNNGAQKHRAASCWRVVPRLCLRCFPLSPPLICPPCEQGLAAVVLVPPSSFPPLLSSSPPLVVPPSRRSPLSSFPPRRFVGPLPSPSAGSSSWLGAADVPRIHPATPRAGAHGSGGGGYQSTSS